MKMTDIQQREDCLLLIDIPMKQPAIFKLDLKHSPFALFSIYPGLERMTFTYMAQADTYSLRITSNVKSDLDMIFRCMSIVSRMVIRNDFSMRDSSFSSRRVSGLLDIYIDMYGFINSFTFGCRSLLIVRVFSCRIVRSSVKNNNKFITSVYFLQSYLFTSKCHFLPNSY